MDEQAGLDRPQLSLALTNFTDDHPSDWRFLLDGALAAEAAGLDRVVVFDHVVMGEALDAYSRPELGGITGGQQPTGPDGAWLEPLTSLAVIAGATTTIRLGTNVLLAALRRPAVLAKTTATLDVLSGGRLDLGVGVGWQREEYDAAGLDFGRRGRLLDHTLEVCRSLWRDQRVGHHSEELSFEGIHMMPKPVAPNGIPIWVSGTLNQRVVSRLARFGAGWIPWGESALDLTTSIPAMREQVAASGRDPEGIGVVGALVVDSGEVVTDPDRTMAAVPELLAAGVTDVRLYMDVAVESAELIELLAALVSVFRDHVADPGG